MARLLRVTLTPYPYPNPYPNPNPNPNPNRTQEYAAWLDAFRRTAACRESGPGSLTVERVDLGHQWRGRSPSPATQDRRSRAPLARPASHHRRPDSMLAAP